MGERLALAVVLIVVAVAVAAVLRRRRRSEPVRTTYHVPTQIDRRDFARPEAPWLVAAFTSATCDSCAQAWTKVEALASDDVSVEEVERSVDPERHDRYGIDAVPTIVVADADGVVRGSFLGPPPAADLWAAVADARER